MDLEFTIIDFTKNEVQVGSSTKYIVMDDDCRELQKSIKEIEIVAKRQGGETWERFVEWAISKGHFKTAYKKKPPKPQALPQKRQRKHLSPEQEIDSPLAMGSDYSLDEPKKRQRLDPEK